jgi:hypothetical protein
LRSRTPPPCDIAARSRPVDIAGMAREPSFHRDSRS